MESLARLGYLSHYVNQPVEGKSLPSFVVSCKSRPLTNLFLAQMGAYFPLDEIEALIVTLNTSDAEMADVIQRDILTKWIAKSRQKFCVSSPRWQEVRSF